jgi:hypothetical protein
VEDWLDVLLLEVLEAIDELEEPADEVLLILVSLVGLELVVGTVELELELAMLVLDTLVELEETTAGNW